MTKYPNITVVLTNTDSNAFSILGKIKKAMNKQNVPKEEIEKFMTEAMSSNYNHLLQTCMKWVNVE